MTVVFDYDRVKRLGMPEAVLCEGKTTESLNHIILELRDRRDHPVLFTRLFAAQFKSLDVTLSGLLTMNQYRPQLCSMARCRLARVAWRLSRRARQI
jgi:NCAIR mutase (PurE)-related protein